MALDDSVAPRQPFDELFAGGVETGRILDSPHRHFEDLPGPAVDDGRGVLARLTAAGDELVAEASPAHFTQVRSMIFDRLDEAQVEVLAEAMQVIATGLTDDDWWLAVRD